MDSARSGDAVSSGFMRTASNPYALSPVQGTDLINFNSNQPDVLIDEKGNFNNNIETKLHLASDKGFVNVVSIMGVQSSGKSTLLNRCFSTGFKEMNVHNGMSQTTKGIGVAKLPAMADAASDGRRRSILVFDCEGTDGKERDQQGDDTFERKLTVFALALSDVVMVNMKCDNVNLNHGASIPLIKSVFQVMVKKFTTPRCVNLVFVLRDKNEAPVAKLKEQLIGQIRQIWNSMSEGRATPYPALDKYFTVYVMALSHYRYEMEAFNLEVDNLRKWIFNSLKHRSELNSAAGFTSLAQRNWNDIQMDKILNLQLNKSTIEDAFCDKINRQMVDKFRTDKTWVQIRKDVKTGKLGSFGKNVSTIIALHLSEFDEETQQFNGSSRDNYRCQLNERLLEIVEDTYLSLVEINKNAVLKKFDEEIAEKIKAHDNNFDPDAFIKEFYDSLLDARIKQADWKQTSQGFEELKSLMADHVKWALFISDERKILKRKKKSAWMAAGGVLATGAMFAGLLTTAIVVPGIGTAAAAAVASTAAVALPATPVLNIMDKCVDYGRKKKQMKELGKQNEITGSICEKLSKRYVKGSNQYAGKQSAAAPTPAAMPDLIDMGSDDSRAIVPVDGRLEQHELIDIASDDSRAIVLVEEPTVFFSEDGRMEQHEFLETWKSLPDSKEFVKQFPGIVMNSVKQTIDRLSASRIFIITERKIEYQQLLYLSAKMSGIPALIELAAVIGLPGVTCAIKTPSPEMATIVFDTLLILLKT